MTGRAVHAIGCGPYSGVKGLKYVKPPLQLMRDIQREAGSDGSDIALDVYCSPQALLREFFWFRLKLLTNLINGCPVRRGHCLDFGGGSGIFLPSLGTGFSQVSLVDLNTRQAEMMIDRLSLPNIRVERQNVAAFDFPPGAFDAVIAADVLEHFQDLSLPLDKIRRWLNDDGMLFTSLPTENLCYRMLRIPFGKQKPHDHYHMAVDVERRLADAGFEKVAGLYHPLGAPLFPLFRISAWRKTEI